MGTQSQKGHNRISQRPALCHTVGLMSQEISFTGMPQYFSTFRHGSVIAIKAILRCQYDQWSRSMENEGVLLQYLQQKMRGYLPFDFLIMDLKSQEKDRSKNEGIVPDRKMRG